MTRLPESSLWEEEIELISRSERVAGGLDGPANRPLKSLANRTRHLKGRADAADESLAEKVSAVKTFAEGATLESPREEILFGSYRLVWTGEFPKTVLAGSTPQGTGGIGGGLWAYTSDAVIREDLRSHDEQLGDSMIAHSSGGTVRDYILYLTPQSQGAPCDGNNDDSTWFNALANSGKKVVVPAGNYILDCNKINITTSDCEIEFDKNANVTVINTSGKSGADTQACVFRIAGTSLASVFNTKISGGKFTFSDDRIAIVGVMSYVDGVKVENVKATGARILATMDASNVYANSTAASRSKRVSVISCRAEAATVATSGAAISFRYSDHGYTQNNYIYGYYYGVLWWGGDSNPSANGALSNERKCVGLCGVGDIIFATKAGYWGSMGRAVLLSNIHVEGIGTDTDVGIDFEGCVDWSAVGCYAKDFRYGGLATFFYNDNGTFDACTSVVTVEGYRPFTINNSSQNINNRSLTYSNCKFIGEGATGVVYQQGAINDLTLRDCILRNVVLHLDALNNGRITIDGLTVLSDIVPVGGRDFNSTIYFCPLIINSSNLFLRNCKISSGATWTGLGGTSAGLIVMSRDSNSNSRHVIDGGGVLTNFDYDVIFANMGANNSITPRIDVDKFVFAAKKYKTMLFSTSTLMPVCIVRGFTSNMSDFPASITDNAAYAETYYARRQRFINPSPVAGGIAESIVVAAGIGAAAVTANIQLSA
ncbi:TPA: hypothetical protein M2P32_004387 [Klebsiella pneumoniae]|nr:hypothetical protein [Klebsiella pneumoniae]